MKLLFKTFTGQSFTIDCELSDTVKSIKDKIEIEDLDEKYKADEITLRHNGIILDDSRTLQSYSIEPTDYILAIKRRPAKTLPSSNDTTQTKKVLSGTNSLPSSSSASSLPVQSSPPPPVKPKPSSLARSSTFTGGSPNQNLIKSLQAKLNLKLDNPNSKSLLPSSSITKPQPQTNFDLDTDDSNSDDDYVVKDSPSQPEHSSLSDDSPTEETKQYPEIISEIPKVLHNNDKIQNSTSLVEVCKGDLITQKTDVIVVCSSSQYLFDAICKAGGDSVSNSYKDQTKNSSTNSFVAVNAAGQLASKRVYFLAWTANNDPTILRQSIQKFVTYAIEAALDHDYRSIAFPAIGCGQYGCSIDLIAQAMIEEACRKSSTYHISVVFVIQPERIDVYDQFQKQLNLFQTSLSSKKSKDIVSELVGNGKIEIEQGDITKQNVDVIIGSISSAYLKQAILKAAGNTVQSAYENELKRNPHSILISTPAGSLSCKKIYFIQWQPDPNEDVLRQSLIYLITIVVNNVKSHNFTSIAFPAIGCGQHGCSVDVVVNTLVSQMKQQIIKNNLFWTVKFIIQPGQQNVYDEFCKQLLTTDDNSHETQTYQLPLTWQKSTTDEKRFVLSTTSDEYKTIVSNFDQAMTGKYMKIVRIERIQNERWYMQYLAHQKDFKRRLNMDTERRLYHGCPQNAAHSIIEDCFNRSFAGVNGTVYGFGVYFSSNAVYSHGYACENTDGERCMFVARVLIGKTTLGNTSMKTRPLGFDSTTDNNHIFVTYHDAQAFAEYLITYK